MENQYNSNNYVNIYGILNSIPHIHHTFNNTEIYEFYLKCPRLHKDTYDILPIEINKNLIADNLLKLDLTEENIDSKPITLHITGQFHSYNDYHKESNHSTLKLFIYAKSIEVFDDNFNMPEVKNYITLVGNLCKTPVYRITPSNRKISDILLAINRNYNKSDYIPCIAWGNNAVNLSKLYVGSHISIEGRIQSRNYIKKDAQGNCINHTAYEVSISKYRLDNIVDKK